MDLEGFAEEAEMQCMIHGAGNTWDFPCSAAAQHIWGGRGPRIWLCAAPHGGFGPACVCAQQHTVFGENHKTEQQTCLAVLRWCLAML